MWAYKHFLAAIDCNINSQTKGASEQIKASKNKKVCFVHDTHLKHKGTHLTNKETHLETTETHLKMETHEHKIRKHI